MASCTVISTVADQVVPLLDGMPSRSPTWIKVDGAFTATVVEAWSLDAFSSAKSWLAVSVCLPVGLAPVFQLYVRVKEDHKRVLRRL